MVKYLSPSARIPRAKSTAEQISRMALRMRRMLIEELKAIPKVSIMLDGWTAPNNTSYMGIFASYISPDWEYVETILDFVSLPERHEGQYYARKLFDVLNMYDIKEKLMLVTADNAGNNITMAKACEESLRQSKIKWEARSQRNGCMAHIVQLAANAIIKNLKAETPHEHAISELDEADIDYQIEGDRNTAAFVIRAVSTDDPESDDRIIDYA
jgi:hypothetical protein